MHLLKCIFLISTQKKIMEISNLLIKQDQILERESMSIFGEKLITFTLKSSHMHASKLTLSHTFNVASGVF